MPKCQTLFEFSACIIANSPSDATRLICSRPGFVGPEAHTIWGVHFKEKSSSNHCSGGHSIDYFLQKISQSGQKDRPSKQLVHALKEVFIQPQIFMSAHYAQDVVLDAWDKQRLLFLRGFHSSKGDKKK